MLTSTVSTTTALLSQFMFLLLIDVDNLLLVTDDLLPPDPETLADVPHQNPHPGVVGPILQSPLHHVLEKKGDRGFEKKC